MNLIASAVATVHFVGITLFIPPPPPMITRLTGTPQSSPAEFVAVMPNIPSHIVPPENPTALIAPAPAEHKVTTARTAALDAPASPRTSPLNSDVEHHEAFLVFTEQDLLDVQGWEVKRLELGFLAIPLQGEHLTFVNDAPDPAVNTTIALPHITNPSNPTNLRPEYQPPAYSDAAAVFEIPNGTLKPCAKDPGSWSSRIDVELTLTNHGTFTIRSGKKSLTVNGNAIVVAANTPFEYVNEHTAHANGKPHNVVYCRMLTSGNCSAAMMAPADFTISHPNGGPPPCKDTNMAMPNGQQRIVPAVPPTINSLMDYACSTTQWP